MPRLSVVSRTKPARPHPALPARRGRGAGHRHAPLAVPQAPWRRVAVARPRGAPARRRRVAGRARQVRTGRGLGRRAGEQVRRLPRRRVPSAGGVEGAPRQEHGEGTQWVLEEEEGGDL
jgi:hypothetical protein